MRPTLGTSTSTTATSTPTTRATTTRSGWCEAERDHGCGGGGTDSATPFGLRELTQAFDACRRGKRASAHTQAYSARLLDHLLATRDALREGHWRPSAGQVFACIRPKLREIHAAPFADRVVHHALIRQWEALYEFSFIHDSYANRVGKGTHAAVDRLQQMLRQAAARSESALGPCALQLDIASFFHSIDRRLLASLLRRRLGRALREHRLSLPAARALWRATRAVLDDEPALRARRVGDIQRLDAVPAHKRLGALGTGIGLPIDNLASQFFGNVLLDRLDQFIKHDLKVRWYVRYVDDFVLVAADPATLLAWRGHIEQFLEHALHLRLRDQGRLAPVGNGVDFLGFVVRPTYRLVRRRTVCHAWSQLADFEQRHRLAPGGGGRWRVEVTALDALRARLASYLGQFRHADAGRLWARLVRRFAWLEDLFVAPAEALALGLQPRWRLQRERAARSLRQQVRAMAERCPGQWLLVEVGNRWRVWDPAVTACARGFALPHEEGLTAAQARQWIRRCWTTGEGYAIWRQCGHQKDGRRSRVMIAGQRPRPLSR